MQNEGGLVSHIFLSMDSDLIFFPFVCSHFLDLNFCFKNPKMSVPGFVPHRCFLSWPPSHHVAARERTAGEEELLGLGQGALVPAVLGVEQPSISQ